MAKIRRFGFLALLLLVLLAMPFILVHGHTADFRKGFTLKLQPPSFVQEAQAGDSAIGQYLDSEAGISAYYQSTYPIDLNKASSACRTVEALTSDYLICSVAVPNYIEHFDTHVFVHKTGWIMAFYFKDEPVSKIIDIKGQTISTTLLKTVVGVVATAAGVPFTNVTYYNFNYPNATKMLFVAEDTANGNMFTIQAPSSNSYFEYSWSILGGAYNYSQFNFDGVDNPNLVWAGDVVKYGTLTGAQFTSDTDHTITVNMYGVLVIVYR